jgi:hypothetical protein
MHNVKTGCHAGQQQSLQWQHQTFPDAVSHPRPESKTREETQKNGTNEKNTVADVFPMPQGQGKEKGKEESCW